MTGVGCRITSEAAIGKAGGGTLVIATLLSALMPPTTAYAQDSGPVTGGGTGGEAARGQTPASASESGPAPAVRVSGSEGVPPPGGAEAPDAAVGTQVLQPGMRVVPGELPEGESLVQPSVQPGVLEPVTDEEMQAIEAERAEAATQEAGRPFSALDPGLPPASFAEPVVQSPEEQVLLGAPRMANAAAAGYVQVDPGRVFGDDGPWLTGLAVGVITGLKYSASLKTEYSSNLFRRPSGAPSREGESRGDWHFVPEVDIMAGRPLGGQLLFLNATLGWDMYARNSNRNKSRMKLNGGIAYQLGTRCAGRLQGDFSTRQTSVHRFADNLSSRQKQLNLEANTACRLAGRMIGSLAYQWHQTTNGLEERRFANSRSHGINGALSYPVGVRGNVSVSGFWRTQEYPHRMLVTGEVDKVKFTGFSVGAGYRIGPSISLNGGIGRTKVSPRNPLSPDFSGTTWSIGANYAGPKLGASLSTGRSASGGNGSTFSISKHSAANLSYSINSRMGATLSYTQSESENRGRFFIPGEGLVAPQRKTNTYLAGLDYRMNRLLSFRGDYRRQSRPDEVDRPGYTAHIFALTANADF